MRVCRVLQLTVAFYRGYLRQLFVFVALPTLWLIPLFLVQRSEAQVTQMLVVYGEVLLPPILGGLCASLVLNDPCRELLLTTPYPLWRNALVRFTTLIATALLTWVILIGLGHVLQPGISIPTEQLIVGGAVTSILFASFGAYLALRLCSLVAGGSVVAAVWVAVLLFREALLIPWAGQFIHPFLTWLAPASPAWPLNRLVLSALAVLLLVAGLRLTLNEERLLTVEETREES